MNEQWKRKIWKGTNKTTWFWHGIFFSRTIQISSVEPSQKPIISPTRYQIKHQLLAKIKLFVVQYNLHLTLLSTKINAFQFQNLSRILLKQWCLTQTPLVFKTVVVLFTNILLASNTREKLDIYVKLCDPLCGRGRVKRNSVWLFKPKLTLYRDVVLERFKTELSSYQSGVETRTKYFQCLFCRVGFY